MRGWAIHGCWGEAKAVPWRPVVLDVGAVGLLVVLVIVITQAGWVRDAVPLDETSLVLVSMAAAFAAMAAILAAFVHRLSNYPRGAWISAAFALYGLVGVPAATIGTSVDRGGATLGAIRLSTHILVVLMLLVAACPPPRPRSVRTPHLLFLGLLFLGAVAVSASLAPVTAQLLTSSVPVRLTVAGIGIVVGGILTVQGRRLGSSPLSRVGIGAAVMSFAHAYKIGNGQLELTFATVRLLGVALALIGLVQLAKGALGTVSEAESARQEELLLAKMGLEKVAERDHELRNGLAGLAGVTYLIGDSPQVEDPTMLRTAVTAELSRLEAMLEGAASGQPTGRAYQAYPIGPVLRDLVALRRCSGMDIRHDAESWLWAKGSPAVLAQVLTNVLANCAKHAPGSPVRVQACRRGDRVRVRVSDFGPGVMVGSEQAVFARGTRSPTTGGRGLGLHICRQLLAAEGGRIEIRSGRSDREGCTVIIELSAARPLKPRTGLTAVSNTP